jgi:hypothetical protein
MSDYLSIKMISSDKYMSCKIVDLDESYKTIRLIQSRLVLTYLLSYYIIHSTKRALFILPVERSHNSRIDFFSIWIHMKEICFNKCQQENVHLCRIFEPKTISNRKSLNYKVGSHQKLHFLYKVYLHLCLHKDRLKWRLRVLQCRTGTHPQPTFQNIGSGHGSGIIYFCKTWVRMYIFVNS